MVAAPVLLYDSLALWTLLGVCRYPVAGLRVVVALFDPLLDEVTPHRVVPVFQTGEAKEVAAPAFHRLGLEARCLDCVGAVRGGAPLQ